MSTDARDATGASAAPSNYGRLMRDRGFAALMVAQFLGALNDNLLKMAIVLAATSVVVAAAPGDTPSPNDDWMHDPKTLIPLAGAAFILPYLLFSGIAGQLADRFAKSRVLAWTKAPEILAMLLAVPALASGEPVIMLSVLLFSATQSAFFSPAKYGILPELLADRDLTRGNALIETSTFLAIILGTALGGLLFDGLQHRLDLYGWMLVGIAAIGFAAILLVRRTPAPARARGFSLNPAVDLGAGLKALYNDRRLWLTVLGISWFWFLGAMLQMSVIRLGREELALDGFGTGLLQAAIGIGIGVGSIAAGRLSGQKVEPGLVPLGSLGMGISALWLAFDGHSQTHALVALGFLGFFGGLFIVPLQALLQQKSDPALRGRIIASNNFVNVVGILLASGTAWVTANLLGWGPRMEVLAAGLATFAVTAFLVTLLPEFLIRFLLWMLTHSIYRIRIVGQENVPAKGPALLVCNHLSFADGLLVGACIQRFVRFMAWSGFFKSGPLAWLLRTMRAIPVAPGKDTRRAIERARAELEAGHVVCIFAEGAISRTGNPLPFRRGLELIVGDLDVPVIPVHLDQVWGSIFSFKGGKFFWKLPDRLPRPVTVSFGRPLRRPNTWQVRRAVLELGAHAWEHRPEAEDLVHARFLRTARRFWNRRALADSTGRKATFGQALIGSLLLAKRFRDEAPMVGVLLPASVGGALVNMGLMFAGKTPVNLNFTAGPESMASAIRRCGIARVVTSRTFLTKARLETPDGAVFVEDLLKEIGRAEKLRGWIMARLLPGGPLLRLFSAAPRDAEPPATVMFSSGSTGEPKGVVLSHRAIVANLEAVAQILWIDREDCIAGVLPFFHSFGFTATLCLPLATGMAAVYHANPLDAKAIGPLVKEHKATLLLGTPTFLQSWMRAATAEDFASLRHVVTGAERLRPELADAFAEKYGVRPLEGYGATEMGPVIAVNLPDVEHGDEIQIGHKDGTVGHPVPGVATKTVDPETFAEVPDGTEGLLLVKGPGMMTGYLGDPARTEAAIRDGWYVTGDIAVIDEHGFIRITDRLARFSKIAGEMVPHGRVEEALIAVPGVTAVCVVGVPDESRGERLVALYTGEAEPAELSAALAASALPKLWQPKPADIRRIGELPTLGTGKLDLKRAKAIAAGMA